MNLQDDNLTVVSMEDKSNLDVTDVTEDDDKKLVQEDKSNVDVTDAMEEENKLVQEDIKLNVEDKSNLDVSDAMEEEDKKLIQQDTELNVEDKSNLDGSDAMEEEDKSNLDVTDAMEEEDKLVQEDTEQKVEDKNNLDVADVTKEDDSDDKLVQEDIKLTEANTEKIILGTGEGFNQLSSKENITNHPVYQETPLAEKIFFSIPSTNLFGLPFVIEIQQSHGVTSTDDCYYICSLCSRKLTNKLLVTHLKSVPHVHQVMKVLMPDEATNFTDEQLTVDDMKEMKNLASKWIKEHGYGTCAVSNISQQKSTIETVKKLTLSDCLMICNKYKDQNDEDVPNGTLVGKKRIRAPSIESNCSSKISTNSKKKVLSCDQNPATTSKISVKKRLGNVSTPNEEKKSTRTSQSSIKKRLGISSTSNEENPTRISQTSVLDRISIPSAQDYDRLILIPHNNYNFCSFIRNGLSKTFLEIQNQWNISIVLLGNIANGKYKAHPHKPAKYQDNLGPLRLGFNGGDEETLDMAVDQVTSIIAARIKDKTGRTPKIPFENEIKKVQKNPLGDRIGTSSSSERRDRPSRDSSREGRRDRRSRDSLSESRKDRQSKTLSSEFIRDILDGVLSSERKSFNKSSLSEIGNEKLECAKRILELNTKELNEFLGNPECHPDYFIELEDFTNNYNNSAALTGLDVDPNGVLKNFRKYFTDKIGESMRNNYKNAIKNLFFGSHYDEYEKEPIEEYNDINFPDVVDKYEMQNETSRPYFKSIRDLQNKTMRSNRQAKQNMVHNSNSLNQNQQSGMMMMNNLSNKLPMPHSSMMYPEMSNKPSIHQSSMMYPNMVNNPSMHQSSMLSNMTHNASMQYNNRHSVDANFSNLVKSFNQNKSSGQESIQNKLLEIASQSSKMQFNNTFNQNRKLMSDIPFGDDDTAKSSKSSLEQTERTIPGFPSLGKDNFNSKAKDQFGYDYNYNTEGNHRASFGSNVYDLKGKDYQQHDLRSSDVGSMNTSRKSYDSGRHGTVLNNWPKYNPSFSSSEDTYSNDYRTYDLPGKFRSEQFSSEDRSQPPYDNRNRSDSSSKSRSQPDHHMRGNRNSYSQNNGPTNDLVPNKLFYSSENDGGKNKNPSRHPGKFRNW